MWFVLRHNASWLPGRGCRKVQGRYSGSPWQLKTVLGKAQRSWISRWSRALCRYWGKAKRGRVVVVMKSPVLKELSRQLWCKKPDRQAPWPSQEGNMPCSRVTIESEPIHPWPCVGHCSLLFSSLCAVFPLVFWDTLLLFPHTSDYFFQVI